MREDFKIFKQEREVQIIDGTGYADIKGMSWMGRDNKILKVPDTG
jgi:hypothetical protein